MPADVVVPTAPPLATVRGVALMHAGQWDALSGREVFTTDDLAAAVAAMDCPAVRRPCLKFGHDGKHGAGEPALGSVDNMALTDEGRTLLGDYVGMPGWLATVDADGHSVLASAYPDRSIEGEWGYRCQIGHTHPFVVHAVALLGVERPGIGTLPSLQDLAATYGVALSNPAPTGTPVTLTVRDGQVQAAAATHSGAMVALIPTAADAQRLAVDGGEPADDLHVTLLYLGDGADWDDTSRQAVIDAVTPLARAGPVDADAFSVSVFNAGSDDRETAIVLGVGGQALDDIHTATVAAVVDDRIPDQHAPWVAHLSLIYSDDLTLLGDYVDRTGPIVFDRLRIAFAGDVTDIPLTATAQATTGPGGRSTMPNPSPTKVSATVTSEDVRRAYYEHASWSLWITEMQLDPMLQLIVTDDSDGAYSRVAVNIDGDNVTFDDPIPVQVVYVDKAPAQNQAQAAAMTVLASTAATGRRVVFASRTESRPGGKPAASDTTPTDQPAVPEPVTPQPPEPASAAPVVPAAEPEPTPDPMEDNVSDLSDIARGLGLPDDAGKDTILAAISAGKTAEPPTPTEPAAPAAEPAVEKELVAASNGNAEYATELKRMSAELAAIKAEKVAQVKASVLDGAQQAGKYTPAERANWEARYDKAPDVITDVLASIAAGTAVPVTVAGVTGSNEPTITDIDTDLANGWAAQLGISPEVLTNG